MNSKVSIIIPIYNTELYLRRCLVSVVSQTLKEIEIICINDGSTDGSLAILEEFAKKDRRIILINQENKGVGTARSIGIERVSSPYIGFVDSDDFISPDMFEKMYTAMVDNDVDLVQCGVDSIFYFPVSEFVQQCYEKTYKLLHKGKVFLRENLVWNNVVLWDKLFKKDLIEKYKLHFEHEMKQNEEFIFWYSYWTVIKSAFYLTDRLYFHIIREGSLIGRTFTGPVGGICFSDWLKGPELYYRFLIDTQLFDKFKFYFWDIYLHHIMNIYWDAIAGAMDQKCIRQIKNFLNDKDISYLTKEKYRLLHEFVQSNDDNIIMIYEKKLWGCLKYKKFKQLSNQAIINTLYFSNTAVMVKSTDLLYKIYRMLHSPRIMFITMMKLFIKSLLPYGFV
jgi:glycosyltransferase involved in cell wall biosynthesis